jgi:hypothetical protein
VSDLKGLLDEAAWSTAAEWFLDALADRVASRLATRLDRVAVEDRWLTTREAAAYLGFEGTSALHRLTSERRIAFSQESPGGKCWFRRAHLDAFREAHLQPPLEAWLTSDTR